MIIISWIFTLLGYAIAIGLILYGVLVRPGDLVPAIIMSIFFFCLFGTIAHFLLKSYRKKNPENSQKQKFLYGLSFLPSIIAIALGFIIGTVIKIIKSILGLAPTEQKQKQVFIVTDENGRERKLVLFDKFNQDHKLGDYDENPFYGKCYDVYKDDIDNYWRSYDGGKSFIKVDVMKKNGWA